jgi:hypothetical protein
MTRFVLLLLLFLLPTVLCQTVWPITWQFSATPYAAINASVGDSLNFSFVSNSHNVNQFLNANYSATCNFTNAAFFGDISPVNINLTTSGVFYYGCSFPLHCSSHNMNIQVNVAPLVTTAVQQVTTAQRTTAQPAQQTTGSSSPSSNACLMTFSVFLLFTLLLFF